MDPSPNNGRYPVEMSPRKHLHGASSLENTGIYLSDEDIVRALKLARREMGSTSFEGLTLDYRVALVNDHLRRMIAKDIHRLFANLGDGSKPSDYLFSGTALRSAIEIVLGAGTDFCKPGTIGDASLPR